MKFGGYAYPKSAQADYARSPLERVCTCLAVGFNRWRIYTFTGQRVDASAGLMYYGARYYDWVLGRFTQPDTIIPNPYNPQDLNRYSYVRNNPLKYIDPSGHDIIIVGGAGWSGTDPYDDPSWWEEWIREYTGWTHDQFMEKFYDPWMKAKTDEEKMKIAQETGVAIFKWDAVPGAEQWGSLADAATYLQKQINDWVSGVKTS